MIDERTEKDILLSIEELLQDAMGETLEDEDEGLVETWLNLPKMVAAMHTILYLILVCLGFLIGMMIGERF